MKICLLTLTFAPDATGGRARYARDIYTELVKRGHQVYVITGLWTRKLKAKNVFQIKIPKARYFWFPFWLLGAIKLIMSQQFDIIHTNGYRESLVCQFLKKPYITTSHDIGAFELNIPLLRKLLIRDAINARKVIVPTEVIKQKLIEKLPFLSTDKIVPLHNGVDTNKFTININGGNLQKELNIQQFKIILYLGRIAFYKGVLEIIKAYNIVKKEITNAKLLIGGAPTLKMKSEYNKWKKEHTDVLFTDFIPEEKIAEYYALADIFVTFSYSAEGFGLTLVEALACGTPVICSDLPAYREVLRNYGQFVPPRDIIALSKTMIRLLKDDERRIKLGIDGASFVKENFSWSKYVDQLIKIYQMV
ncbi:MAG: glycosyltransferase family 4 protein [Promethearchaeota archaeon]